MIEFKYSDFDSEILGVRAASLTLKDGFHGGEIAEGIATAKKDLVDFVHFRVGTTEIDAIREAREMNFEIMDVLLQLRCSLKELPIFFPKSEIQIRATIKDDMPAIEAITKDSMKYTRLHVDPNVPMKTAEAYYATWISNIIMGTTIPKHGAECRTALVDGNVVGYVAIADDEGVGRFILQASHRDYARNGVARNLAYDGLVQCKMRGCESMETGVLLRSPIVNMYMDLGYRHHHSEYSLHWWAT